MLAWISIYSYNNIWDEIIELHCWSLGMDWISNVIQHFIMDVVTYSCDLSQSLLVKMSCAMKELSQQYILHTMQTLC